MHPTHSEDANEGTVAYSNHPAGGQSSWYDNEEETIDNGNWEEEESGGISSVKPT